MAEQQTFRMRITFAKQGRLALLSHLEVARAIERAVRRAQLPFAVSQGFSPHMKIAFGAALPVGVGGTREMVDLQLLRYVRPEEALLALQKESVPDLMVKECVYIEPKAPAASAAFPLSTYRALLSAAPAQLPVPEQVHIIRKKKEKVLDVADFLVGEMLHGDYRRLVCDGMLHSATNYECYKGLHSSLNSDNLFEIGHSLQRQFGPEPWTVYKGLHLFNFADNHDVTRAANILRNPAQLPLLYALLFAMPGIPCVYYGSEWGAEGVKSESDAPLRPCFPEPAENGLTRFIASLAAARRESPALRHGDFRILLMTNRQLIFERRLEGERMLAAFNAEAVPYTAHFDAGAGRADELLTGRPHDFGGGSELNPYSASYWRIGG